MPVYKGQFIGWMIGEGEEAKYYHGHCLVAAFTREERDKFKEKKAPLTTDDLGQYDNVMQTFICDHCGEVIELEEEE